MTSKVRGSLGEHFSSPIGSKVHSPGNKVKWGKPGSLARDARGYFFLRPRMPPLRKSPAPRTNPKLYQLPLLWIS